MELTKELIKKHIRHLVEATVKSHTRTSKTGKVFNVKQHDRREDSIKDEIKQVKSDIARSDAQILAAANAGGRIPQAEGGESDMRFVASYRMDREGRLKELRSHLRTIRKERAAENKEYGYTIGDQSIKFGKSKADRAMTPPKGVEYPDLNKIYDKRTGFLKPSLQTKRYKSAIRKKK